MIRGTFFVFALMAAVTMTTPARANDQCNDVLRGGAFANFVLKDNWYSDQVRWARNLATGKQRRSTDVGVTVPVPGAQALPPVGGNFSGKDAREYSNQAEYFGSLSEQRQLDLAVASGDKDILDAWGKCMDSRGGLVVRFGEISGRYATVHIRYKALDKVPQITISKAPYLPAGVLIKGENCIPAGRIFAQGDTCRLLLEIDNDHTIVPFVVNTNEGVSGEAWLPKRIRLISEPKNFVFAPEESIGRMYRHEVTTDARTVRLDDQQLREGWYFDQTSAVAAVVVDRQRRASCTQIPTVISDHTFTYGLFANAPRRNPVGNSGVAWCHVTPQILIWRDVWIGINGDVAPNSVKLQ